MEKLLIASKAKLVILLILILFSFITVSANQHPGLFLTPKAVKEIKKSLGKYPDFDKSVANLKKIADKAIISDIIVPFPKDGGGGYTHEKHKNNYYEMNAAGIMYQISGNKAYAQFVTNMLIKYAQLYPTIDMHPIDKSTVRGKLFWQTLNESVWLVHTANAYDCVYNFISEKDRTYIEKNLFYPMAEFISNGNPKNYSVFNKMHNHGTWATSAVGMIGYAMGDKELVNKALYGSNKDAKAGFVRQLDVLFSPDGYFTEGPYYHRYALWPFMTFAQVIENQQPELKIFAHRDSILMKAVNSLIHLAYNGEFFYLNDALTKTYESQELIYAIDIAYKNNQNNKQLLDIARQQKSYIVSGEGLATAKAASKKKNNISFNFHSTLQRDGQNGDEGGVAILRKGNDDKQQCLVFKATSHGLSHGHYDKLSIALYDNGNNILSDYGASRFLNIEPKSGGGYTNENDTWAHQTIAHNTVTVDEKSNFNGDIKISSKYHSDIQYFDNSNPELQIISAIENNAYQNVQMQRTTALISNQAFEFPIVLDFYRILSESTHTYDYPFYYHGQMVSTNFEYKKNINILKPMGNDFGYQHLWVEAKGKSDKENAKFTWYNANRFYSITSTINPKTELYLTRIGANDPEFNLRNDAAFMLRENNVANHSFASAIEPHGLYDLVGEVTIGFESSIQLLEIIEDNSELSALNIKMKNGKQFLFVTVNKDFNSNAERTFEINGQTLKFKGNYHFEEITNQ